MNLHIRRLVLAVLTLIALFPFTAQAESTPEAKKWLEKFIDVYSQGPFKTGYNATIEIAEGEQTVNGSMNGNLTYGDPSHMRMELTMMLSGMPGAPAGETTEMKMLAVSDGELTWTEVHLPAVGMQQIMKISLEDAKKLAEAQGMGATNPAALDPVQQLQTMTELLDFELVKVEAGEVHLKANMTEKAKGSLGQMAALPGLENLALILDESTGFPKRFSMGGDQPMVTIAFEGLEFVDAKDLPGDAFVYTPPEGAQVIDLGSMISGQAETSEEAESEPLDQ